MCVVSTSACVCRRVPSCSIPSFPTTRPESRVLPLYTTLTGRHRHSSSSCSAREVSAASEAKADPAPWSCTPSWTRISISTWGVSSFLRRPSGRTTAASMCLATLCWSSRRRTVRCGSASSASETAITLRWWAKDTCSTFLDGWTVPYCTATSRALLCSYRIRPLCPSHSYLPWTLCGTHRSVSPRTSTRAHRAVAAHRRIRWFTCLVYVSRTTLCWIRPRGDRE
mmetsp:Transcript_16932/g.43229  ORF Transcript_16932/g.43229 Transcript_16932/m.43229 type:complete len:225 (-) Transcript_16932:49-723(-)